MFLSRPFVTALAAAVTVALLSACGQKGALYLRDNPPAGIRIPKPAIPKPVPYPADVESRDKQD